MLAVSLSFLVEVGMDALAKSVYYMAVADQVVKLKQAGTGYIRYSFSPFIAPPVVRL